MRITGWHEPAPEALAFQDPGLPQAQGLYAPQREHDACGVGFIADMHNRKSHEIITQGLQILLNLDHRGAVGADPKAGDGCGMLVQIPHRFFVAEAEGLGFALPAPGDYAIGAVFLPRDPAGRGIVEAIIEATVAAEGQVLLGWRDVPVEFLRPWRKCQADRAGDPADLHRAWRRRSRPGHIRAPPVYSAQSDFQRRP